MGGSLAFHFFCVPHAECRLLSQVSDQTSDPTLETFVVLPHREAGGSGSEPTPPALAAAPTLGIHLRAPGRQSTERGSAQPIISVFPFLASPNLAHGCCWRSKINQPPVIHRCLLFLSHFHLLFICRLCMMPRHYLLC